MSLPQVLSTANSAYLVGGLTPDPTTENGVVLSSIVRYDMNTGLSEELPRMEANGVELPRWEWGAAGFCTVHDQGVV